MSDKFPKSAQLAHLTSTKRGRSGMKAKSDRIFIAFCNSLIVSGAMGLKLSRVLEVHVEGKACIYLHR